MFTIHYKGFPVECDTALEVVALVAAIETPTKPKPKTATKTTTRATPSRAEKDKRNAKAREAYRKKQEAKKKAEAEKEKGSTTTTRLEALPSQPTTATTSKKEVQKRARTSTAVIATLKRSPSPLTLEEIDMDLEKSGWPYAGADRKGAIRATLNRLKAKGTVSTFLRGTGMDAMQMFRLERTNGEVESPVEQLINNRGEESKEEIAAEEARADAEGDPNALGPGQTPQNS